MDVGPVLGTVFSVKPKTFHEVAHNRAPFKGPPPAGFYFCSFFLPHLAFAALRAISLRCSFVSFSARAFPPLLANSEAENFFSLAMAGSIARTYAYGHVFFS